MFRRIGEFFFQSSSIIFVVVLNSGRERIVFTGAVAAGTSA